MKNKPDSIFIGQLEWHEGPARGGQGTSGSDEDGYSRWYDGDRLMIIVETNVGRQMAIVDIDADEHYFRVTDASTEDSYDAWGPEDWSWWARLDKKNLPPVDN